MEYTESVNRLIEEFSRIPGIGRKTAERCAYYILKSGREDALKLATAIQDVKSRVRPCEECGNLAEDKLCAVCADPARDRGIICVVEQPKDVIALEKAGIFRGVYHVLMGTVAPLDGVGPADLNLDTLRERAAAGGVQEVIVATNPTTEGEGTAHAVCRVLEGSGVRVTRIAKGIPTGSSIEYMSSPILADALEGRRDI